MNIKKILSSTAAGVCIVGSSTTCLVSAAPTLIAEPASDDNQEKEADILQKIFGSRHASKDVMLEFDVVLDGEDVGQAMVLVGKQNKILVKSLKEVLSDYLNTQELNRIDEAKIIKDLFHLQILISFNLIQRWILLI